MSFPEFNETVTSMRTDILKLMLKWKDQFPPPFEGHRRRAMIKCFTKALVGCLWAHNKLPCDPQQQAYVIGALERATEHSIGVVKGFTEIRTDESNSVAVDEIKEVC